MSSQDPKKETTGIEAVADMLQYLEPDHRQRLLEDLEKKDPGIAKKVRTQLEQSRWGVESLFKLNPVEIQTILKQVPVHILALALRRSNETEREKLFLKISTRAADHLRDEISQMGPQPRSQVDAACRQISQVMADLAKAGKINPPA